MNPIDQVFQRLRGDRQRAFIPFISAGDPDLPWTGQIIEEFVRRRASIVEIGFPYSDPIADGVAIQASYTRALARGLRVDDVIAWAKRLRQRTVFAERDVPLIAMASYSLLQRRGAERFVKAAQEAGFAGAIVPDLPFDEAGLLARFASERDFKLIQLVTPNTSRERALRIAQLSTGFLYCVSVKGVTGERGQLPHELLDQLKWLRGITDLPLCVGFGISRPEHVRMLRDAVDGIIVGSAFVCRLDEAQNRPQATIVQEIGTLAASLENELNPGAEKKPAGAD
jgi:tryptophan synthase alpha chain